MAAQHREHGTAVPEPQGRSAGQFGKLSRYRDFLLEIVQAEPDITFKELARALAETHGVEVQLSSLHRALERAGLSYKKRTVIPPNLKGLSRRTYAAVLSFIAGVMPPMAILGLSLL